MTYVYPPHGLAWPGLVRNNCVSFHLHVWFHFMIASSAVERIYRHHLLIIASTYLFCMIDDTENVSLALEFRWSWYYYYYFKWKTIFTSILSYVHKNDKFWWHLEISIYTYSDPNFCHFYIAQYKNYLKLIFACLWNTHHRLRPGFSKKKNCFKLLVCYLIFRQIPRSLKLGVVQYIWFSFLLFITIFLVSRKEALTPTPLACSTW